MGVLSDLGYRLTIISGNYDWAYVGKNRFDRDRQMFVIDHVVNVRRYASDDPGFKGLVGAAELGPEACILDGNQETFEEIPILQRVQFIGLTDTWASFFARQLTPEQREDAAENVRKTLEDRKSR